MKKVASILGMAAALGAMDVMNPSLDKSDFIQTETGQGKWVGKTLPRKVWKAKVSKRKQQRLSRKLNSK